MPKLYHSMMQFSALLSTTAMPLVFAGVLLLILIISFRSRAVVFCQYLERMTGIELKPADKLVELVRRSDEKARVPGVTDDARP